MRSIGALLFKSRWLFAFGQAAMLAAAAAGLAFPWTVRNLFATVLASGSLVRLLVSVGVLAGVLLLRDLCNYAKRLSLGKVSERVVHSLRDRVYDALLARPLAYFRSRSAGELSSAASNDITAVQSGLTIVLTNLVQQAVVLVTVVTMLFVLDPLLAAIVCLFVPPLLLVGRRMGTLAAQTTERRQRVLGEIMSVVQQSVAGIEVIRSYLLEGRASALHRSLNDRSLEVSVHNVRISAAAALWSGVLGNLFLLTVMGFGGYRVITGHMATPDLIAFILYSEMITGPFVQLATLVPELARTRTAYARIARILEEPAPTNPTATAAVAMPATPRPDLGGRIEYDAVSFSYDGRVEALQDVSFAVDEGETVAIIGPSGAGKSTIMRLLPRLYDPTAGSIRTGGLDIATVPVDSLRAAIAMVSQEPFIFDLSVADNIRCGRPDASDAEVHRAAGLANAHEFIDSLAAGYETFVGDAGSRLSGGQRQRIAIARAFLRNPRILLLDEATSALDRRSEASVLEALEELKRGRTTLVIAHRFDTIRNADRVLVVDNGRLVDEGTHEELAARCELYVELSRSIAHAPVHA